jgi:hypothetical protein
MTGTAQFIVTDATSKDPSATGSYDIAISFIMHARGVSFGNWQDGGWRRDHFGPSAGHEILDAHPLFLFGERRIAHDLLNGTTASDRSIFFHRLGWTLFFSIIIHFVVFHIIVAVSHFDVIFVGYDIFLAGHRRTVVTPVYSVLIQPSIFQTISPKMYRSEEQFSDQVDTCKTAK